MATSTKGHWEKIATGYTPINLPKLGKSGNALPDLQILLPDNQRVSIWLDADKSRAFWQLVQDTDEYRNKLESGGTPPLVDTNTTTTTEAVDDDLPF